MCVSECINPLFLRAVNFSKYRWVWYANGMAFLMSFLNSEKFSNWMCPTSVLLSYLQDFWQCIVLPVLLDFVSRNTNKAHHGVDPLSSTNNLGFALFTILSTNPHAGKTKQPRQFIDQVSLRMNRKNKKWETTACISIRGKTQGDVESFVMLWGV